MALKKIINIQGDGFLATPYGDVKTGASSLDIPAYIKITDINGNKEKLHVIVNFSNKDVEFTKSYYAPVSTEDNAPNFIKQAYEYLKTLPEFENSEDC